MFKKMVTFFFVVLTLLVLPLEALAYNYEFYDIEATGTDRGYTTTPADSPGLYRNCGSYSVEFMTKRASHKH